MKPKTSYFLLIFLFIAQLSVSQAIRIKWIVPDEVKYDRKSYDTEQSQLDVEIDISTSNGIKVSNDQLRIYRNGVLYSEEGKKLGTSPIKKTGSSEFRLSKTLELLEGKNEWRIEVAIPNQQAISSKLLTVNWLSGKPNLYILCVGVANGLTFPQKDAEAIFNTFRTQSGHLFGKVEGEMLVCQENTTRSFIGNTIANLENKGLRKQDVLILFFSGHGQTTIGFGEFDFGLVGSDKLDGNQREEYFLISYQKDIIKHLNALPCKRLIFFDACKSGAATGAKSYDFNEVQKRINNTPPSIITISSSSSSEASWEDGVWKHGAFTKSILDGLAGAADKQKDKIITIQELADYIITTVPNWVLNVKKKPQHPRLIYPIKDDYPIFNYQNKDDKIVYQEVKCGNIFKKLEEEERTNFTKKLLIAGIKPNNFKEYDNLLSSLAKTEIQESHKGKFNFEANNQAINIIRSGLANKLIGGEKATIPAEMNEIDYILILKRIPTTYRQETLYGSQVWIASTIVSYSLINSLTKEILDSGEINMNGSDADKTEAEKRALERALSTLKININ